MGKMVGDYSPAERVFGQLVLRLVLDGQMKE